ncbi:MAG: hypothetical protein WAV31_03825 [Candidatus Moraniibacteriota bacterium]
MKMLESAAPNSDVKKKRDKYAGRIIIQREGESRYKFLRRVIVDVIMDVNPCITVCTLIRDLRELTDIKITTNNLLATVVFKGSGILVSENVVWASESDRRNGERILIAAEKEVFKAGGMMERDELFTRIRKLSMRPFSEKILEGSIKNKGNLKWRTRKGRVTISTKE